MVRIQLEVLKILLDVQLQTQKFHVVAEFGRYPLHITWQSPAAKYLQQLEYLSSSK